MATSTTSQVRRDDFIVRKAQFGVEHLNELGYEPFARVLTRDLRDHPEFVIVVGFYSPLRILLVSLAGHGGIVATDRTVQLIGAVRCPWELFLPAACQNRRCISKRLSRLNLQKTHEIARQMP